jgi:hypothetical protein
MSLHAEDVLTYPVLALGGDGAVTTANDPRRLHEMTRRAAEDPYAKSMRICDESGRLYEVKTARIDRVVRRRSRLAFWSKIYWVEFELEHVGSVDVAALKQMVLELMRNKYPGGYANLVEDSDLYCGFEAAADLPQLIAYFTPARSESER